MIHPSEPTQNGRSAARTTTNPRLNDRNGRLARMLWDTSSRDYCQKLCVGNEFGKIERERAAPILSVCFWSGPILTTFGLLHRVRLFSSLADVLSMAGSDDTQRRKKHSERTISAFRLHDLVSSLWCLVYLAVFVNFRILMEVCMFLMVAGNPGCRCPISILSLDLFPREPGFRSFIHVRLYNYIQGGRTMVFVARLAACAPTQSFSKLGKYPASAPKE